MGILEDVVALVSISQFLQFDDKQVKNRLVFNDRCFCFKGFLSLQILGCKDFIKK